VAKEEPRSKRKVVRFKEEAEIHHVEKLVYKKEEKRDEGSSCSCAVF